MQGWLPDNYSIGLALLNQSEYLPNQILHGSVGLVVFLVLFLLGFRRPSLRAKYLRVAAYFHLGLAVGVLIFKLSSFVPLDNYLLAHAPVLERFYPFEPAAHMVQELATMGAYAYVAVFYLRNNLVNVIERPRLHFVLGTAFHVYGVCWLIALTVGLTHPFPMTGLDTELNSWSVLYRAVILLPGIFYCAIFSFIFFEAALEKSAARSSLRLGLLCLGSVSWTLICAEQFGWAAVHALAPEGLRNTFERPHVLTESSLYALMGLSWLGAFLVSYRPSPTERSMEDHREYHRLMKQLKGELNSLYRRLPEWKLTLDRMHRAGQELNLTPEDRIVTQKCVELVALLKLEGTFSESKMRALFWVRQSLAESLPANSVERLDLLEDPVGRSLGPALHLVNGSTSDGLPAKQPRLELAAAVAADKGFLTHSNNYELSPPVRKAYATS